MTMPNVERAWRLTIEKSSGQYLFIYGTRDMLQLELEEWIAHEEKHIKKCEETENQGEEYKEYQSIKPRVIYGFSNDASRSEVILAYRFCDVVGMVLDEI